MVELLSGSGVPPETASTDVEVGRAGAQLTQLSACWVLAHADAMSEAIGAAPSKLDVHGTRQG